MSMTLAMTASQTNAAKTAFAGRYYVSSTGDTNFSSQFSVSWDDFAYYVQDLMNNIGATEENLLLQFFHRYNTETRSWFLTMGGGILSDVSVKKIDGNNVYPFTPGTYRYDLSADGITPSAFDGEYADDYFDNFYYRPYDTTYLPLSADTSHTIYVSAVSMVWLKEVYQLYVDNNPSATCTVNLVFASISCDCPQPDPLSSVEWPHTICLFLNIDGNDALNDLPAPASNTFKMKAADYGTMAPPGTGCDYIMPSALTAPQGGDPGHD